MKGVFVRFAAFILVVASISTASAQQYANPGAKTVDIEALGARWKAGSEEYDFNKDGTSLISVAGRQCPGTWVLSGSTITINPRKLMYKKDDPCSKTQILKVISWGADGRLLIETADKKQLELVRQQ